MENPHHESVKFGFTVDQLGYVLVFRKKVKVFLSYEQGRSPVTPQTQNQGYLIHFSKIGLLNYKHEKQVR